MRRRGLVAYAVGAGIAVLAPLWLVRGDFWFVSRTHAPGQQLLELFGLCASVLVLVAIGLLLAERGPGGRRERLEAGLPWLLPLLLSLAPLQLLSNYSLPSGDWLCYETAARRALAGQALYADCYLYPPLPAQLLAGLWWLIERQGDAATSRVTLFYLYQTAQFFALQLAIHLCFRLALRLGIALWAAAALTALLFWIDEPLQRTLRFNQVNLFVLDAVLVALLAVERRPWPAGLAAAVATHIKLQPLMLIVSWGFARRWSAVAAGLLGLLAVAGLQVGLADGAQALSDYARALPQFPRGSYFRDNSLASVVQNTVGRAGRALGVPVASNDRAVEGVLLLLAAAVLCLYLLRAVGRERAFAAAGRGARGNTERLMGHGADALVVALLLSPLVWEHHYVLAIPVALFAAATAGRIHAARLLVAGALIFALPTFDVFPLSFHRLVGLLLLVSTLPVGPAAPGSGLADHEV